MTNDGDSFFRMRRDDVVYSGGGAFDDGLLRLAAGRADDAPVAVESLREALIRFVARQPRPLADVPFFESIVQPDFDVERRGDDLRRFAGAHKRTAVHG